MSFTVPAHRRGGSATSVTSTLGRVAGVDLVLWPEEAPTRAQLAAAGRPCLLVLTGDAPVPDVGPLEDWAREPLADDEVRARCTALARRATCGERPVIDDGLLIHQGAWVAIPPAQVAMVELLVDHMGELVHKEDLVEAAAAAGGSPHEEAVKAALGRLAKRLGPVGLALRSVRGRGYILEAESACPVHGTRRASAANPTGECR